MHTISPHTDTQQLIQELIEKCDELTQKVDELEASGAALIRERLELKRDAELQKKLRRELLRPEGI